MGAFADLSAVVNRITGGNSGYPDNIFPYKDARIPGGAATATVVGRLSSLWNYIGIPSHGVYPGASAAYPDNATDGALKQFDPTGGRQKWLLGVTATSTQLGQLILYDRLAHYGGLSGTVTSAQSCALTLSSRYTGTESPGNEIWAEIHTIIGTTGTTISASYTDQDGNSGITSQSTAFGATGLREVDRIIPIPLAVGDTGVRAIASVTVLASTGTAGAFGVVIARPLLTIPISIANIGAVRDLISGLPSIVEIKTDACLAWSWLAGSTTAPQILASVHMAEV